MQRVYQTVVKKFTSKGYEYPYLSLPKELRNRIGWIAEILLKKNEIFVSFKTSPSHARDWGSNPHSSIVPVFHVSLIPRKAIQPCSIPGYHR